MTVVRTFPETCRCQLRQSAWRISNLNVSQNDSSLLCAQSNKAYSTVSAGQSEGERIICQIIARDAVAQSAAAQRSAHSAARNGGTRLLFTQYTTVYTPFETVEILKIPNSTNSSETAPKHAMRASPRGTVQTKRRQRQTFATPLTHTHSLIQTSTHTHTHNLTVAVSPQQINGAIMVYSAALTPQHAA